MEPVIEKFAIGAICRIHPPTLALSCEEEFNLNITSAFLQCCTRFGNSLVDKVDTGHFIRNETGQILHYWIGNEIFSLNPDEERELSKEEQIEDITKFRRRQSVIKTRSIDIQVSDLAKIHGVSLEKPGRQVYNISRFSGHLHLICDIQSKQGDHLLLVQSPFQVQNNLDFSFEIRITLPLANSDEEYSFIISCPEESLVPLPITCSTFTAIQVRFFHCSWSIRLEPSFYEPIIVECPQSVTRDSEFDNSTLFGVLRMVQAEHGFLFCFDPPITFVNQLNRDVEFSCSKMDEDPQLLPVLNLQNLALGVNTKTEYLSPKETFNWCSIAPNIALALTLRLTEYPWAKQQLVQDSEVLIYEFQRRGLDNMCILANVEKSNGVFKVTIYSQYSIENFTSLPMLFQYFESNNKYAPISLPFEFEGHVFDNSKSVYDRPLIIVGNGLDNEMINPSKVECTKPWQKFSEDENDGLLCLVDQESRIKNDHKLFSSRHMQQGSIKIQVAQSEWSDNVNLIDQIPIGGRSIMTHCRGTESCIYEVSVNLRMEEMTRVIRFTPRFIFHNKIPEIILLSQYPAISDRHGVARLLPGERCNFHWPDSHRGRNLIFKLDDYGWQWSGQFSIDSPSDFFTRVRNAVTQTHIIVHVTIELEESSLIITLEEVISPYRIENHSMEVLKFHQVGSDEMTILKHGILPYAWDEPMQKKMLKLYIMPDELDIGTFKLNKIMDGCQKIALPKHGTHPEHDIYIEIYSEGSCKILSISHEEVEARGEQTAELSLNFQVNRLNISVINSKPEEIMLISFAQIGLMMERFYETQIDLQVESLQIDNQLYSAIAPVLLCPLSTPCITMQIIKRNDYYRHISFALKPLNINLDGFFIENIMEYAVELRDILGGPKKEGRKASPKMFDKILIDPLQVNLSFTSTHSMFKNNINPLRMLFITFGNVGNVIIEFSGLKLRQRFTNTGNIVQEMSSIYFAQCRNQALNILASSEALGNPNELFRQIKLGIIDLLTFTGQPTITGVFKGMSSFVRHTTYGTSNSFSKFLESVHKGMLSLYVKDNSNKSIAGKIGVAVAKTVVIIPSIVVGYVSDIAKSATNLLDYDTKLLRQRPPRCFVDSKLLTPYSYTDSVGRYVLATVEEGRYLVEGIKGHAQFGQLIIVVTSERIIAGNVDQKTAIWKIRIKTITLVKVKDNALLIYHLGNDSGFKQDIVRIEGEATELDKLANILYSLVLN